MLKPVTQHDIDKTNIRLELLRQQQAELTRLKQHGINTQPFEDFLDDMINDEHQIRTHYERLLS